MRLDQETRPGTDRAAVDGAHREVVPGEAVGGAVGAEHLAQHPELERRDLLQRQYGDARQHPSTLARDWQEIDGQWHLCHCPARSLRRRLDTDTGADLQQISLNGEAVMELFVFFVVFSLVLGVAGQLGMIVANSDPDVPKRSFIGHA
ncbi:hypothetical protein Cs7R123_38100 [Catellatospora sp. TT07R-123]|nr:hypothetical protein Cs7R123_38100 [Catellatospora sp. TT07R-123]